MNQSSNCDVYFLSRAILKLIAAKKMYLFRPGQTFIWTDSHLRTFKKKKDAEYQLSRSLFLVVSQC